MQIKITATSNMPRTGTAVERLTFGKLGYMEATCEVRNHEQMTAKEYNLQGVTAEALAAAVAPELRGQIPTMENLWTAAKCAGIGTMVNPKGRKIEL